eukprot:TRINITY_DN1584_c0_g1_i1.p1 TRINITY_DN1584_c0_g1~~TRINITY_DN1584_c0_g1_i1.p1  ORF type:complete len:366 (-),score=157.86 TRINITY_DN1584_c0_g1_i1:583-1680(-)
MAPRSPKRGSSSSSSAAKKAKTAGNEVTDKVKTVVGALALAEKKGISESVIALLSNSAEHCLGDYADQRHPWQKEVVGMVSKVLQSSQEALEDEVAAAEALVNGGGEEKTRRETAVAAAEQALAASEEAHKAAKTAKDEGLEALEKAKAAEKEAAKAKTDGDAEVVKVEANKKSLESAVTEALAPLKENDSKKVNAKLMKVLIKELTAAQIEDSLIQCMQITLHKPASSRASFDAILLEQLDMQIASKLAAFSGVLSNEAPAREQRAAAADAAAAAAVAADSAAAAAAKNLNDAKHTEAVNAKASKQAKASAKNLTQDLLQAAATLERAKLSLEEFKTGALSQFNELKDRSTPPLAAEEAAPATE